MRNDQFMAVDGVSAWPDLTKLPDGTLVATIFNQPQRGANSYQMDVVVWEI